MKLFSLIAGAENRFKPLLAVSSTPRSRSRS